MGDSNLTQAADPWSLLAKAEDRCKLGLINEAVIIADEAVEAGLTSHFFARLEATVTTDRKEALEMLRGESVKVSTESLLRLSELRKRAEQDTVEEDLSSSEAEEAISIAEEFVTKISEEVDRNAMRESEAEFTPPIRRLNLVKPFRPSHGDVGQFESEFVTKLLLAKAILSSRKKRIPHIIGLMVTALSALICFFFCLVGGSGIVLTFTGRSLFSISGLLFSFVFLLLAYLFLRITVYAKRETR